MNMNMSIPQKLITKIIKSANPGDNHSKISYLINFQKLIFLYLNVLLDGKFNVYKYNQSINNNMNNQNQYQHHFFNTIFNNKTQKNTHNQHYNHSIYQKPQSQFHQQFIQQNPSYIQNSNMDQPQNAQKQSNMSQSQMMSNLTFSIQDLLSKISKVRQQYEDFQKKPEPVKTVQPKVSKNNSKQKQRQPEGLNFKQQKYSKQQNHHNETFRNHNSNFNKDNVSITSVPSIILHQIQKQATYIVYQNKQENAKVVYQEKQDPPRSKYQQFLMSCKSENLLLPEDILKFGNALQIKNTNEWKKSIILDDGEVHIEEITSMNKKFSGGNSLFDGKFIRQVAASQIFDNSPQKIKRKQSKEISNQLSASYVINEEEAESQPQFITGKTSNKSIKTNASQKVSMTIQNLTIRDFQLGKSIGSGKFGDVFQALHKKTNTLYAIKKIFKSTLIEYDMIEQFTRQLKIHYKLDYPNIIKLYTHFSDQYHVFLVMEYAEGGMLMDKIKQGEKFASIIVEQMLRSVEYLHQNKIAHRDIKPENIVLMFQDTAKLCDFGWSRVFDSDMKKTFCGTLDYVSPQMKDKGQYSLNIDIWSLGVLTFEIICGFAPFKDQISNWKRKGGNLNHSWNWNILYPPQVSGLAQSFMRNLLKQNPNQRANIRFCRNHLFIRKHQQAGLDLNQQNRFKQIGQILK